MSQLTVFALAFLAVACSSLPIEEKNVEEVILVRKPIAIVKMENEYTADGGYQYGYETSDGSAAAAKVYMRPTADPDIRIQVIEGSYSYIGEDGQEYKVFYIADDKGFQVRGDHLPAIPEHSLQQIEIGKQQIAEALRAAEEEKQRVVVVAEEPAAGEEKQRQRVVVVAEEPAAEPRS